MTLAHIAVHGPAPQLCLIHWCTLSPSHKNTTLCQLQENKTIIKLIYFLSINSIVDTVTDNRKLYNLAFSLCTCRNTSSFYCLLNIFVVLRSARKALYVSNVHLDSPGLITCQNCRDFNSLHSGCMICVNS